jgi:hypothetical protein
VENIDEDGMPCEEFTGWRAKVLQFEWSALGIGFFICTGRVFAASVDDDI